ncbi:hypothetical protein V6N13_113919 [Hibiscus sabdariffa]
MKDVVTSEAAQELFEITTDKFQEMVVLTLLNWGNVRMSKARKHVKLIEDSTESMLAQVRTSYEWEQKEYVFAAKMYWEALKIKSDFYKILEEVNSIGAYIVGFIPDFQSNCCSIPKNLKFSRAHKLILAMMSGDESFVEPIPKSLQNLMLKSVKENIMNQFASDNMKTEQVFGIFATDLRTCVCNLWNPKDILLLEALFFKDRKCYSSDMNTNKNKVVLIHGKVNTDPYGSNHVTRLSSADAHAMASWLALSKATHSQLCFNNTVDKTSRSVIYDHPISKLLLVHTVSRQFLSAFRARKMTIIEMRVHMDCAGCESKVKSSLEKLKGVDEVDIDMGMQKVTVTGYADQKKVLKTVRKTGRRAELWQLPYNPEHHSLGTHYYNQHQCNGPMTYYAPQPSSSYNYYKHGYDSNDPSYYRLPVHSSIFGHQTGSAFSDENPHACSLM